MTPPDARQGAERRWNEVRGRFKHQLAQQRYDVGAFEEAILNVTETIALEPERVEAYVLLARANLELGRTASADRALGAARRLGVESPELIYTEGVILEQRGEFVRAEAKFRRAHTLDQQRVEYVVALAECLVALDRADEALTLVDTMARSSDDNATVQALAAHIAMLLGRNDEATRRYREALDTSAPHPIITEALGLLLIKSKRYTQAVDLLAPLVADESAGGVDRGTVRRALATAHLVLGHADRAMQVLQPYADYNTDDGAAQLLLAKAALAAGDNLTALQAVERAERVLGRGPESWLIRAAIAWRRGNHVAAATYLHDVLANRPEDIEAHCMLGEVLRTQRDLLAARNNFERALSIDPGNDWARQGLRSLRQVEVPTRRRGEPKPRLTSAIDSESSPFLDHNGDHPARGN